MKKVIDEPIEVDGQVYHMTGVSMGNPHTVIYVDDVKGIWIWKRSDRNSRIMRDSQNVLIQNLYIALTDRIQ